MTGNSPEGEDFDYGQPFEVDIGRAELARPERERGMVGRFAADALEQAGWRP